MRRTATTISISALILTLTTVVVPASPAVSAPPAAEPANGVVVSEPSLPGLSKPARSLAKGTSRGGGETTDVGPSLAASTSPVDPVAQTAVTAGDAPVNDDLTAPLVTFAGQQGGGPPDTVGDVGPNHYVQMINSTYQIWNKTGTSLAGPTPIQNLWTSDTVNHNQCDLQNAGDPIVLYDQTVDRWMLSQFTNPNTAPFDMCIAYSQTPDPGGAYFLYSFRMRASHDYMKYGVWPDGLYMSTFEGGTLGAYAFDRAAMVSGSPATFQYFGGTPDTGRARMFPSDWDGVNPPVAGEPNHFLLSRDADNGQGGAQDGIDMYDFHVDWNRPALSTFTLAQTLNTAPFDINLTCQNLLLNGVARECIPTGPIPAGSSTTSVDALPGRLMHRVQYRNFGTYEAMVAVQSSVDADGADRSGSRWYELRKVGAGAWSIHQQGTYAPGTADRWMGSAAMDGQGNIAMGYSFVDPTNNVFPSVAYTGRLASAPLGSMPETERRMVTGTNAQVNFARWGDYSSMNVDPVDDCTFWYTQQFGGNQRTQIGSFRFTSCTGADLSITKGDNPDPVLAGQSLTYTVDVRNAGPKTAGAVTVTDVLPAGVTFQSSSPDCTNAAGTLTCALGSLLAGQATTLAIQVGIPAGFLGSDASRVITNTASVAAANQFDPVPGNNTATQTTTVQARADLAVTKVCKPDEPASAGAEGFCDIHVDNLGPSNATGVVLTDVLTSATPFSVTGVTVTPSGTCAPTTAGPSTSITITCTLGSEPSGGRTTVRVSVTATDVAQINDVASVSSATPDPSSANNTASGRVDFIGSADLVVSKTGPATVVAGQTIQYTLTVRNDGPSTARAVTLTDTMPLGVSFVSVVASVGTCTTNQPGQRTLTCGLGDLLPGPVNQATVTVNGLVAPDVAEGTSLFNEAVVSSATADPDNTDNRAGVTTTVTAAADLRISKSGSPSPVVAGTKLTYTVTVTNDGPSTARDVEVTDTLPAGTTYVSGKDGNGATVCTLVQSNSVVCALNTLAPGASKTVFITVLVSPAVPQGTVLRNAASVGASTPDPDPTDNTAQASTTVNTSAELWLDKQGVRRSGNPSPVLVYSLVVHNDAGCETDAQSTATPTCGAGGPSDAQGITVVDRLPLDAKKVVVQYVSPQCTYVKATHTVTCRAATVPAGASVTFVIEAQVSGSVGTVLNTATLTATTPDPVTANNSNAVTVVIKGGTGKS